MAGKNPVAVYWANAGLEWVLVDNRDRVAELTTPSAARKAADVPASVPAPPAQGKTVPPQPEVNPVGHKKQPRLGPGVLPIQSWPSAWQAVYTRRPLPPRPLVVWTYPGLGDDLLGQSLPARQQLIVQLLKHLRHPTGTHVFWPYAVPAYTDQPGGHSLFWSGEALLKPRVILVFGQEAAHALGFERPMQTYSQQNYLGKRLVFLPPPMDMIDSEAVWQSTLAFLSRLLSFCSVPGRLG